MSSNVHTIPEAHEILMEQLPDWFKPVLEYIAIMQAYAVELSGVEAAAAKIQANYFVETADADTLKYWEDLMNIPQRAGDTLEFRRTRIMLRLNQRPPITVWDLRDKLTELFGTEYSLEVNPEQNTAKITVTSDRYGAVDLLYDVINEIMPTHLAIIANQEVNNTINSNNYAAMLIARTLEQTVGGNDSDVVSVIVGNNYNVALMSVAVVQSI